MHLEMTPVAALAKSCFASVGVDGQIRGLLVFQMTELQPDLVRFAWDLFFLEMAPVPASTAASGFAISRVRVHKRLCASVLQLDMFPRPVHDIEPAPLATGAFSIQRIFARDAQVSIVLVVQF